MGEGKFVPLDAAMGDLEKLKKLREEKETQARESAFADLDVEAEKPELRSVGAAAKDFNKKKGAKKVPPVPAKTKTAKVEKPEGAKTEAEMANELATIKTREDLLGYLGGLKGLIKIKGHVYSFSDYIFPRAQKILGGEIPWAAMEVSPLGEKLKEIIGEEKRARKKAKEQKILEQENQFKTMSGQIQEYEAALMVQINNGAYAKLKDVSEIYIFHDIRHKDEIRKLSKDQQVIIRDLIKGANERISEAVKAYREKAEQDKQAPRKEFVKEHGDKFKTNLFDAEGNWVNIQECLKDGRVKIVTGQKADSKGTTSYVPIVKAIELLGQYVIAQEKSAPETKPEDSGAAAPIEAGPKNDLEAKKELMRQKIESKFSELFAWDKIEGKLQDLYASRAKREEIKKNELAKMKERVLGIAEADGWHAISFSEDEIDKLIVESFSTANEEINNKKGNLKFLKFIREICTAAAKPAEIAEVEKEEPYVEPTPIPEPNPERVLTSEPVPMASPVGEKYLGEEIPEEKKPGKVHEFLDYSARYPEKTETDPAMYEADSEGALRQAEIIDIQEKLAQLKTEIDQARKEYLEDEYKKTNAFARLRKVLGIFNQSETAEARRERLLREDSDLAHYRAYYDNKLFEYKNLLLEDAKERKVSNEELGNVVKVFAVEANINMQDAHTDVKIENHEGKISGKLKDFSLKIIESYRKLPTATKLAIGAGFLGAGAMAGSAGVGLALMVKATALRRFFMGAVTGTSVALGLESRDRGKTEQRIDEESKAFAETVEKLSEEKKYEAAQRVIDQLIYDEDQKINKIKNKNIRNLAVGVGVGTLVGSANHWMGMLRESETGKEIFGGIKGGFGRVMEYFHHSSNEAMEKGKDILEPIYNKFGYTLHENAGQSSSYTAGTGSHAPSAATLESPGQDGGAAGAGLHSEAPVDAALENPINLEVQEGSSLEGTLIKHLESTGMDTEEAGRQAHLMALEYAEQEGEGSSYGSLIHPGANIEISPDGDRIVSIYDDDNLGYLPEKEINGSLKVDSAPAAPSGGGEPLAPETTVTPEISEDSEGLGRSRSFAPQDPHGFRDGEGVQGNEQFHETIKIPENGTGAFSMDPETLAGIDEMESILNKVNGQLDELDDKILKISSGQYEGVQIWPSPERVMDELREQKQALEHAREKLTARIYAGHVGTLRKLIYGGIDKNWGSIGKMPANELLDRKSSVGYKFFARVMDSHSPKAIELQRHISPLKGEKVDEWIIRIGKIMKKSGIGKI